MHVSAEGKGSYTGLAIKKRAKRGAGKKRKLRAKENAFASSTKGHAKITDPHFWPDNTLLLQRKIAQLVKKSRPFVAYMAGPENQLLPCDNLSMNNASVICYNSKGPVQNLNCKVRNRTDGSLIECRHLAYAFLTSGFGLKTNANKAKPKEPGSKFKSVASVDSIRNNAAIKTDQQLVKTPVIYGIPKVAVYFAAEHFGQALYDVWMNKGVEASHGRSSQTWLIKTENHIMAIKLASTAGPAIKIVCYDPNFTTVVRRAIVMNEEILQQLTLNQFVAMPMQKNYVLDQGRVGVFVSTDSVEAGHVSDVTIFTALTPSLLCLLMRNGQLNSSFINSLKMTLPEVWRDNPREFTELLAAKDKAGTPGLFLALHNAHQEVIKAYLEIIKQLRDIIDPETIWELLAAKREDEAPGLLMALKSGHHQAISAYLEGINQLRDVIEPKILKELLIAKPEGEVPGLFAAMQNGHHEAVRAYLEGIMRLRDVLEPEVIKELLAAKAGDGVSGLLMALHNGHQEAISAYIEGIKQFAEIIGPKAIEELLAAKAGDGTSGLCMALYAGHRGAVSAYVEGLKQYVEIIGPKAIKELLAANTGDGTSGLFVVLDGGRHKAISAYIDGIKQYRGILEPELLWELLVAKDRDGTPGFVAARLSGREKALRVYVMSVKQFEGITKPGVIKELICSLTVNAEYAGSPLRIQPAKLSEQGFLCEILQSLRVRFFATQEKSGSCSIQRSADPSASQSRVSVRRSSFQPSQG